MTCVKKLEIGTSSYPTVRSHERVKVDMFVQGVTAGAGGELQVGAGEANCPHLQHEELRLPGRHWQGGHHLLHSRDWSHLPGQL